MVTFFKDFSCPDVGEGGAPPWKVPGSVAGGTSRVSAWLPGPEWHAENPGTCLFVLVGAPEIFSKKCYFCLYNYFSWLLTDTGDAEDYPFWPNIFRFLGVLRKTLA